MKTTQRLFTTVKIIYTELIFSYSYTMIDPPMSTTSLLDTMNWLEAKLKRAEIAFIALGKRKRLLTPVLIDAMIAPRDVFLYDKNINLLFRMEKLK